MNVSGIIHFYLIGAIVIVSVQFLNLISFFLEIPSWHDLVISLVNESITIASLSVISIIFLFFIAPLFVGLIAYVITKIFIT